jgi:hypothetical protein
MKTPNASRPGTPAQLVDRPAGDDPSNRLLRYRSSVVEVAVVVENRCPVVFAYRRSKQIDNASGAMLGSLGHRGLNRPSAIPDLWQQRQIGKTLGSAGGDRSILLL